MADPVCMVGAFLAFISIISRYSWMLRTSGMRAILSRDL